MTDLPDFNPVDPPEFEPDTYWPRTSGIRAVELTEENFLDVARWVVREQGDTDVKMTEDGSRTIMLRSETPGSRAFVRGTVGMVLVRDESLWAVYAPDEFAELYRKDGER